MNFTAKRTELLAVLSRAASVSPAKSPSPIIACVLLRASGGKLSVLATDMMLSFEGACACHTKKPGSLAVSAKDLLEKVKSLPESIITFAFDGKQLALTAEGSKRKFMMSAANAEDFPKFPEVPYREPDFVVEAISLSGVINATQYAADMDSGRQHLHSVLLEWKAGKLRSVACSGYRLCIADVSAKVAKDGRVLVPLKSATELSKISGEPGEIVSVYVEDSMFHVSLEDGSRISTRLGDAQGFPPYEQLIPKSCTTAASVERSSVSDAIKAVASSSDDGSVILDWKPEGLMITSRNPSKGSGEDEVCVSNFNGPPITVASNARYILDAVSACGGERVIVQMTGHLNPIVIVPEKGTGFLGLVMPLTFAAKAAAA